MAQSYKIIVTGESRSFAEGHTFVDRASSDASACVYVGAGAGRRFAHDKASLAGVPFVLVELGTECLGAYLDEGEAANVFGFARFRLGHAAPSNLIELVRPAGTGDEALAAAKDAFASAGLVVAVCGDFPGRIVDRLARPYYNAALRRLDEKLASAADLDKTLCLGLGYPEGPIALLERSGLAHHYGVTKALYESLGDPAYAPARRATNAAARAALKDD
ncbi:3-hydroxyacyl-CoA dehydrogenase family protein [Paraburkholderia sp. B3]|uniref:3-hydroxyacyl-CoA dehydrogenase family protein n=1 Tax=Paraburkholderia sp. B3 TaxID=3134791 RepID=UPI003982623C